MSKTKLIKKAKEFLSKPAEPRTLAALQQEYTNLCAQVGQLAFQIDMHNSNLMESKKQILAIIKETNDRKQLDAAKALAEGPKVETQDVPETK